MKYDIRKFLVQWAVISFIALFFVGNILEALSIGFSIMIFWYFIAKPSIIKTRR